MNKYNFRSLIIFFLANSIIFSFSWKVFAEEEKTNVYQQLNMFGEVYERVRREYVEDVSDKELIEAAIEGMLQSLDPHSSFMNEDTFKDMQVQTKGEFGGLGIEVSMEDGFVKVVSPIDDTPAFEAGVEAGDFIIEIDGVPVKDGCPGSSGLKPGSMRAQPILLIHVRFEHTHLADLLIAARLVLLIPVSYTHLTLPTILRV